MDHRTAVYRIYLLTIWQQMDASERTQSPQQKESSSADAGDAKWCFTLEDPRTGQRRSFSTMVALLAAVQAEFPQESS